MKIKGRVQLRKSVKNKLLKELISNFGNVVDNIKDLKFEAATVDKFNVILVDGDVLFFKDGDTYFPTVKGVLKMEIKSNNVVVDSGAVRFVANGADIMCPGIVSADPGIKPGDHVIIVEEAHGKPLAIGQSLLPAEEMVASSGKAIKSLHYVGDDIWNIEV